MGVLEALVAFQFQTKHLQHRMVKPRVKMRGLKKKKELKTEETSSGVLN